MQYYHTVSGLANVESVQQYDYDMHIQEYYWNKIKVVGPINYTDNYTFYRASLDSVEVYGYTPDEAKTELMKKMGF